MTHERGDCTDAQSRLQWARAVRPLHAECPNTAQPRTQAVDFRTRQAKPPAKCTDADEHFMTSVCRKHIL